MELCQVREYFYQNLFTNSEEKKIKLTWKLKTKHLDWLDKLSSYSQHPKIDSDSLIRNLATKHFLYGFDIEVIAFYKVGDILGCFEIDIDKLSVWGTQKKN